MTTYRVRLADGSYAERVSKSRVYTHATVITVGARYQGDDVQPGDELVLAWHTSRDAASAHFQTRASEDARVHYLAAARFATVEAVEEAPRKATCVNTPTPVDCLHKHGTPTKGSTMNKHRVILANGVEATRNSASRVYTHATVVTVGEAAEGDYHKLQAGDEFVLVWHMTAEAARKKANSSEAAFFADKYKGSVRVVEVELLPKKARKAPSAKVAEPVQEAQEAPVEAPVEPMPADFQDAAQEAEEAPAKDATDEILALLGGGILDDSSVRLRKAEATAEEAPAKKKQTTRMLKVECAQGSGYKVRLARAWLDSYGAPSCPCHGAVMVGE